MLAPWAGAYVGVPFLAGGRDRRGWDCYGALYTIYRDIYHIELPRYALDWSPDARAEWPRLADAVKQGLADWDEIPRAEAQIGDGCVLRVVGQPLHVGLIVGTGPLAMLHVRPQQSSVIERLDHPLWARRLAGVYRWRRT